MNKLYTNDDYLKFELKKADKDVPGDLSDDSDRETKVKKKRVVKNYKKE